MRLLDPRILAAFSHLQTLENTQPLKSTPGDSESVGEEGFSKVRKGVFLKFSEFGNHCFREK